jgi:hypothetical protein
MPELVEGLSFFSAIVKKRQPFDKLRDTGAFQFSPYSKP